MKTFLLQLLVLGLLGAGCAGPAATRAAYGPARVTPLPPVLPPSNWLGRYDLIWNEGRVNPNAPLLWLGWDFPTNGTRVLCSTNLKDWHEYARVWTGNVVPVYADQTCMFFH